MSIRSETVSASYDSYVGIDAPAKNFGGRSHLWVKQQGGSDTVRSFLYFPVDKGKYVGVTILSAILSLHHDGNNAVASYSVRRVTQRWREGQVDWNNQPKGTAVGEVTPAGGGSDKERFNIDVTPIVQAWASGAAVYGFRLATTTNGGFLFYSSEAAQRLQPKLRIEWTPAPDAPTGLRPGGGRAVSAAAPLLLWDGDTPTAVHVQIDTMAPGADFSSPVFDSDWVTQDELQYDTATDPAPPSLVDNTDYQWRVQIMDETGQPSPWSSAKDFERRSKGVLAITSPGATVQTTTPSITHTFTGRTQESVRYELLEDGVSVWVRDRAAQDPMAYEIPSGLIRSNLATYTIIVRVWDRFDRDGTDGAGYVEATKDFTFATSASVSPVANLVAQSVDGHVNLSWSRSVMPDFFAVRANGAILYDRVDPSDVATGGTNYGMKFWKADPGVPITYMVEAVQFSAGVYLHSQTNPSTTVTFSPIGVWVTDPDSNTELRILGTDDADATVGETGETFFPLGRRDPVRLIDNVRGLEGSVQGTLISSGLRTAAYEYAVAMALKSDPLATRRLVFGYVNIPVLLGEISIPPTPLVEENYDISFEFWQVDEFL